jgi:predicted Zn-dependent protease
VKPLLCALLLAPFCLTAQDDPILRAMRDELKRSMTLKLQNLETPYYIDYELDDAHQFSAMATLGGLITSHEGQFRIPRVRVRVGNYDFDNTNWVGSAFNFGSRYEIRLPLDNSYEVLRQNLWLATDQSYKSALEAIARKRAALRNLSIVEKLPDVDKAQATHLDDPVAYGSLPAEAWKNRARSLSSVFLEFPKLKASSVEFTAVDGMHYLLTSEGTEVREHAGLGVVRIRAMAQAADGMQLRDAAVFQSLDWNQLPGEAEMQRASRGVAENLNALVQAPIGENYSGPILFEGVAASQLFAEVLGRNLSLSRKPVLEPGNPGAVQVSELEGRQGVRILPESFNVVDDPTQKEWHGHKLFGAYRVDDEGVQAGPVTIVDKGVLKNFLLTRQPIRGFQNTNGRARLPGSFGARAASFSNLFIQSADATPAPELRQKLIDICKQRDKPYGIVVRKLDFPSSASLEEVRRILSGAAGGTHPVSLPVLVYKVYADGHEELIRGVRLRGVNVRSFKDIIAAGNDANVFDYLENGVPYAVMGLGSETAESTVIAPSILIDDLDLVKMEDELPKLPVVPPPVLTR